MRHEFEPDLNLDSGILETLGVTHDWDPLRRDKLLISAIAWSILLIVFLFLCSGCFLGIAVQDEGMQRFKEAVDADEREAAQCQFSTEIPDSKVQKLVEGGPTWCQLLSFIWSVTRAIGNLAFLIYAAWTIGPLRKNKPWDLERHIVIYVEGCLAAWFLLVIPFAGVCVIVLPEKMPQKNQDDIHVINAINFKNHVQIGGNFSLLKTLPLANPAMLWGRLTASFRLPLLRQLQAKGTPAALAALFLMSSALAICVLLVVCLAMMSVCIKVAQFGFIAEGIPWTLRHYLDFVSFVNALTGLRGDVEEQRLNAVLEAVDDTKARRIGFMKKLADKLFATQGRLAALVQLTTTSPG